MHMTARGRQDRPAQVNIRLDQSDAEVLAAIAFLNDSSAAEIVRPVVERFLREQQSDPEVQAALTIRARRRKGSPRK